MIGQTKIICADVLCKYNGDKNVCMAPRVALEWSSIMTLWDGRKEFNTCKTRNLNPEYESMLKEVRNAITRDLEVNRK